MESRQNLFFGAPSVFPSPFFQSSVFLAGSKPLPPAPCSFHCSRFVALIAVITVAIAVAVAVAVAVAAVFVSLLPPSLCRHLLLPLLMLLPTPLPSPPSPFLKWRSFAVLGDSYWSRGLVLRVPSREKILKQSICFKLTNECWKTYSENYGES